MAKITVPYSTSRIPNEITGDRNLWAGHVQHNGTLYLDDIVARGTVVSSDSQTINCTFAAGIAPGTYALVVSARNGNRSSLAPAEARIKNVVVK